MLRFSLFLFLLVAYAWAAKPMEPLTNYNVIMVHGAAASKDGKKNGDVKNGVCGKPAYENYGEVFDAAKMMGKSYKNNEEEDGYNLTYWLDSAIFENVEIDGNGNRRYLSANKRIDNSNTLPHFSSIYLQRPFMNPAESPRHNAHELGDGTWKSSSDCKYRYSLIEEAQEVRTEGIDSLKNLRKSVENRDKLPPSRNILIASRQLPKRGLPPPFNPPLFLQGCCPCNLRTWVCSAAMARNGYAVQRAVL